MSRCGRECYFLYECDGSCGAGRTLRDQAPVLTVTMAPESARRARDALVRAASRAPEDASEWLLWLHGRIVAAERKLEIDWSGR